MKLKLTKIPAKPFILIFSVINVIAGFVLGTVVTIASFVTPPQDNTGGIEAWAILIMPILNGLLGLASGAIVTALYNFLAKRMGGVELEFEALE